METEPPESEQDFRKWLEANAVAVLKNAGLAGGHTVLDYGCGAGTFAMPAATVVGPKGKVYALDIDATALATLRKKAQSAGFQNIETILVEKSDLEVPLAHNAVDVALLYDVLQLVECKRSLLAELSRVLKPDGVLSVFPMHIGAAAVLELANKDRLLTLRDCQSMIMNFEVDMGAVP